MSAFYHNTISPSTWLHMHAAPRLLCDAALMVDAVLNTSHVKRNGSGGWCCSTLMCSAVLQCSGECLSHEQQVFPRPSESQLPCPFIHTLFSAFRIVSMVACSNWQFHTCHLHVLSLPHPQTFSQTPILTSRHSHTHTFSDILTPSHTPS